MSEREVHGTDPHDFGEVFAGQRVMAILRGQPPAQAVALAERAWGLGLTLVEVTVHIPEAVASLEAVVAAARERGLRVGAGTVTQVAQVRQVAEAGAAFTIAPGLDVDVARASREAGLPHLPGIATPTELQAAQAAGLDWVKAFPASLLGPDWFTAIRGPFPHVPLVATGGINADNARAYLDAGANVVAVGSALADSAQVERLAELLADG